MYFCPEDNRNGFRYPLASRREFISQLGLGMGVLGMASLFADNALAEAGVGSNPLLPKKPHFPAKAKHVVHIFAQGAPSQVDTWDPKPALTQYNGKTLPGMNGLGMASPFKFTKRGKSGIEVSEVFSAFGEHVDDMAIIRSMFTDIPAHEPGTVMLNTGTARFSRPSLGSWAVYGLGTENQNMPGFISLRPNGGMPPGGTQNWQSAFLPGVFQGTSINTQGTSVVEMIQNIRSPFSSDGEQRRQLDLVQELNKRHSEQMQHSPMLEAKIESAEIAFKMQSAATDAFDLSKEPQSIKDLYGTTTQGRQLLLARRLIERGVRFVQVWAGGWDHHNDLQARLTKSAGEIDKPMAAFMTDLKQRGLLDSTLVIWGGEFGRKPTKDKNGNDDPGRDHNNQGFSTVLAGGGIKGGTVYGSTDEFGYKAVENKVHVHDLHATVLALLGFDHTKLTYRYNGRDFRLTDVYGNVVKNIIA